VLLALLVGVFLFAHGCGNHDHDDELLLPAEDVPVGSRLPDGTYQGDSLQPIPLCFSAFPVGSEVRKLQENGFSTRQVAETSCPSDTLPKGPIGAGDRPASNRSDENALWH
jgi:hypothetical protein